MDKNVDKTHYHIILCTYEMVESQVSIQLFSENGGESGVGYEQGENVLSISAMTKLSRKSNSVFFLL